ncbi:MAG: sulfurtransferase TusA family protein, partial [Planctomycetes bacterium]|nr:sulfurtransferase TusA family protein [Planctomycetota bacterium]
MDNETRPVEPILQIPQTVKEDVLAYRQNVEKFQAGGTSAVAFRAYRVPMGIYEQRREGHFMVRIRIGAGLATAGQLRKIAELSKQYGNGILHITTRQDIQIHEVNIENTPDVLEKLLAAGLSARGGGGNTVRNVSACPGSGICSNEKFEVAPYAVACAEYLLQDRSSFNLPRKYKIAFSGCPEDCALASVADLGFFGAIQNGQKGFVAYAGGGLGSNPAVGVKIEDFIKDDEIFTVAQAVKNLFDKHGDRSNKNKARLRYVLKRVGQEEFVRMYKEAKDALSRQGLSGEIPEIRDIFAPFRVEAPQGQSDEDASSEIEHVWPEKTDGLCSIWLTLNLGDITADGLAAVADIADEFGSGLVRTTQFQNLLINGIKSPDVESAVEKLKQNVKTLARQSPQIVACTGAATCKLGLCLSRGLATAIADSVPETSPNGFGPVIRISGCPNSCGHHYVASIGFQGRAKRVNGRLMPCYDVLAGANIHMGDAKIGEKIGTVPAKRIPEIMAQVLETGSQDFDKLKQLVEKYSDFSSGDFPDEYFYDFGADTPFSLAGRGPGECGAGVMDVMVVDIDEAKQAIKTANEIAPGKEQNESIYKAVVAATRALLITFGMEPKKDREIFAAFGEHLIKPGWVALDTQQLLDKAIDYRIGDIDTIADILRPVESLVNRIDELFKSLDAGLKFKAKPLAPPPAADQPETQTHVIDLRGVACPMNFVKAKIELEKIDVGGILEVLLDGGEPIKNVPASFVDQG